MGHIHEYSNIWDTESVFRSHIHLSIENPTLERLMRARGFITAHYWVLKCTHIQFLIFEVKRRNFLYLLNEKIPVISFVNLKRTIKMLAMYLEINIFHISYICTIREIYASLLTCIFALFVRLFVIVIYSYNEIIHRT